MTQTTFVTSPQQDLIHAEMRDGTDHLIVEAYAGTGKTTTMALGVLGMREKKILMTCFNTRIAVEGNKKLKALGITHAEFKTLHSIGAQTVQRFWPGVRVGENFERQNNLTNAVCASNVPLVPRRLVSQLHSLGREILPHATRGAELFDLAVQFECIPDEQWEDLGFSAEFICERAAEAMVLAKTVRPVDNFIDFSDMIFLPVANGWLLPMYDAVIVDEAQDLTVAKLELAQSVSRGRVIVVGDRHQAIYGFCGADSHSLSRLRKELKAKELRLTKTFRCGRAIVEEARKYVPDFEAAASNPDGEVLQLEMEGLTSAAQHGDMILSRLNAPLVSVAMRLLRNGKRAQIAGRKIGDGLVALVRKFKARSIPDFLSKVSAWETKESTRLTAKYKGKLDSPAYQTRLEAIGDQAAMLANLTDNCKNVADVTDRIVALFKDDGLGSAGFVTCSSVHKAKGLEARRVFVLEDTLRDTSEEELNIRYVAITRAIETLVYVRSAS